jgi:C4-type Zn-finger protein
LKKIWNAKCGEAELTIIIEDPSGNSAIISEKAVVEPFKGKSKKAAKQ